MVEIQDALGRNRKHLRDHHSVANRDPDVGAQSREGPDCLRAVDVRGLNNWEPVMLAEFAEGAAESARRMFPHP
jgi:hypothetical protein